MNGKKFNQVSSAIWPWQSQTAQSDDTGHKPAAKRLLLQVGILTTVSLVMFFVVKHPIVGCIVLCIGSFIVVSGLFFPRAYSAFDRLGNKFGQAVGICLTWLLLVPFFYICFSCGRAILAITGKDPLHRKCPTEEPTYWTEREPQNDRAQYRKQY